MTAEGQCLASSHQMDVGAVMPATGSNGRFVSIGFGSRQSPLLNGRDAAAGIRHVQFRGGASPPGAILVARRSSGLLVMDVLLGWLVD